ARARWSPRARSSRPRPRSPTACSRWAPPRRCAARSPARPRSSGCARTPRATRRSPGATRRRSSPPDAAVAVKKIAFLVFPRLIDYLKTWGDERPLASVCTGALLLGRAGYLRGLRATTHHRAYDLLRPFCREVITDARVVDEGRVVTAGGVASSLDLGLYLVEKFWGAEARQKIAAQMEYRSYSPV